MAPNSIGPAGMTTATQAELVANFTSQLQTIYGSDINTASDTPDGEWLNVQIQAALDNLDLQMQSNNMFDPDNAIGVILDQRVAINGIQRQGGTYSITNVTVVTNQSVNLYGQDQAGIQPVYTVSDSAGNLWELITTQLGLSSGSNVLAFEAANPGAVLTVPNTITIQVTIVLGVVSVNNPTTYTTLGINQESDANLRLRRQQSVSLASQGYYASLYAALLNINGVTGAFVYENDTSITDGDGVPGHTIWVIVGGSPADSDVANAIYQKRNAGAGMFGSTEFTITQVNGTLFDVFWSYVTPQNLFISFTAGSINGTAQPNISSIVSDLPTGYVPGVFQEVNINGMACAVQDIDPNTLVTNAGFSNGETQILTLSAVAASGSFEITYAGNASVAINWNDSIATIQSKVQAISGLSSALVTGSIASQTLTFNLSSITNVQALIYVSTNGLLTSGSAAISFSYNEGYSNTLIPTAKSLQFAVSSNNIIILPMILSPSSVTVTHSGTQTFVGLGGYGTYSYVLTTNNSSGSIDGSTGVYTAGGTFPVVDIITVTDSFGNQATATVNVN